MKASSATTFVIRLLTVAALSIFLWRAFHQWIQLPTLTLTLVVIGEIVTISIYLAARTAREGSFAPIAVISTLAATFFFYFVSLRQGDVIAPLAVTATLQIGGIVWQIMSKISLGRSFGLLPANRGVVTRGAYKVVRHPIYLGYLANYVGFLLASYSHYNLCLFSALVFFQILRILEEEKLLKRDPQYLAYMSRTRFRLIPGVF